MSDDSKQTEKIFSELLRDPATKVVELKSLARREVLDTLASLLHMASQKSRMAKSPRVQQRWATIFGYLAQVSTRIVRDLEYEQLRSELDELKRRVLSNDVTRLRRTILAPRYELGGSNWRKSDRHGDSR